MAKKKMTKRKWAKAETEVAFEEALEELERIVAELESGELGLADALERYERGITRLKQCHTLLERATRKIEVLSGVDAAGNPITEPFDESEAESLEKKQASRARRRGGPAGVDDRTTLF